VKDYRYKRFILFPLELQSKYRDRLQYLKPQSSFRILGIKYKAVIITELTFREVTYLQKNYQKRNIFAALQLVFKRKGKSVPKGLLIWARITNLFAAVNYIRKELENIAWREKQRWEPQFKDKGMSKVNTQQLARFGNYNIAATIGERFGLTPLSVFEWEYDQIFTEVARHTAQTDVVKKYHENQRLEAERKRKK